MADQTQQIPNEMRRAHGRFERYQKAHTGRRPIPEALWKMAADLANEHGVFRTAKVLRLDYNKLKAQKAALSTERRGRLRRLLSCCRGCRQALRSASSNWKARAAKCAFTGRARPLRIWSD